MTTRTDGRRITDLRVEVFRIPTEGGPESDGTLVWDATTLVVVELEAAGVSGIGYTYSHEAAAELARTTLRTVVVGEDPEAHPQLWSRMIAAVRNLGRSGIAATAVSAVDVALWDLRAKLFSTSVASLTGAVRTQVPVYGSGGFTSATVDALCAQLGGWVQSGIPRVKMKVGRDPEHDAERVAAARQAIGSDAELFVDANGAYAVKQAVEMAHRFEDAGVRWFEEPVYYDDLDGLSRVRSALPPSMELASGEYGYAPRDFTRMLAAGAVDVMQADATRCGGFTGLFVVDALCLAHGIPLSTHCAPYLHLQAAASLRMLRHMEYFADHVRIERMLFDGPAAPVAGGLTVDAGAPGMGLELKRSDAARFAA